MPFCFKFSFSYNDLVDFMETATFKSYSDAFNLRRTLIIYPKGRKDGTPTYLTTDTDLFPPNKTHPLVKSYFEAMNQNQFNDLYFNLSMFDLDGDISLVGLDNFQDDPPILGSPN